MGAGLPAKRPVHPTEMSADRPPSRAGSLPQFLSSVNVNPTATHNTCGSGLAREEVGTFNRDVGRQTAFASKPAPTVLISSERQSHGYPQYLWERACPRRGRHIQQRCWQTDRPFASKPAPTVLIFSERQSRGRPQSLWERACSRRGRHIQHRCRQTDRYLQVLCVS
ncbi:hypothetical protein PputUW4_03059 [Pseudomonas sp. UW4]|nr:hypothetical protein PputUW4_03059 [Pseudomonas sp. UW4]